MNKLLRQLRFSLQYFVFFSLIIVSQKSHAVFGLLETAEIIPSGVYRVGVAPQLYLGNGGGLDTSAFLDMYIQDSVNSRIEIGSGVTDFWASASAKWVPYPDYENQPAIGFRGKLIYIRDADTNLYSAQVSPIFSKRYSTEKGTFVPYAGLPLSYVYENSSHSLTVSKLCFGTEWVANSAFQAGTELELDLGNSGSSYTSTASTLSLFLNFQFDERIGFKK
jgi:hypothetical protein